MNLKRLIRTLLWFLAIIGGQFVLVFLRVLILDLHSLTNADMWISLILSVVAIECMAILQKEDDDGTD